MGRRPCVLTPRKPLANLGYGQHTQAVRFSRHHQHAHAFQARDNYLQLAAKVTGTLNTREDISQYIFQPAKAWKVPIKINNIASIGFENKRQSKYIYIYIYYS